MKKNNILLVTSLMAVLLLSSLVNATSVYSQKQGVQSVLNRCEKFPCASLNYYANTYNPGFVSGKFSNYETCEVKARKEYTNKLHNFMSIHKRSFVLSTNQQNKKNLYADLLRNLRYCEKFYKTGARY